MTVLYKKWQPLRWKQLNSSWEAPTDCKHNGDGTGEALKWLKVTISSHIGTQAVRYCSEEGNETSLNGLTQVLPSAYHGCNPSPPSTPIQSSARTLTAFPAYTMTINMDFTRLPFPSSHKRANLSSEANFQQISLLEPSSTTGSSPQLTPSPVHLIPPLWGKRSPVLQN